MTAELLREAAAKMREDAERVTYLPDYLWPWHPTILAVADWLDLVADLYPPDPHTASEPCPDCRRNRAALAVARAYLGRQP